MCPAFGLAEATLLVSSSPTDQGPKIARLQANELEQHRVVDALADDPTVRNIVGCGKVFSSTRVAIVDPETLIECSPHEVGEIWVNDRAVAQGYWQRPEESEQIFRATISGTKEGPFLRTGDLGFLKDGELFIAGRIKDVIIIRGTNHHPQDIEWTVQATNTALRPENGAAFSVVVDGEERLVVAQEVEREHQGSVNFDDLTRVVRQAVAESHDLDLYALILLTRGSIPKTASGKIQRQACRPYFHDGGSQVLATWRANAPKAAQPTVVPTPLPTAPTVKKAFENAFASAEVSKQRADDLIMWLREYSSERINSRLMDERRCIPPYILLDFGNRGIMGMQVAERYGGLALRYVDTMRVLEQLGAIDLTLAAVVFLNSTNGVVPIQRHAKAALRDELLPRLAAGRELASFALSEPGAGANLGGVVGQARPDGKGGWRIHAYKRWNSASWAGIVSVFVRLVDERGRLGGLTGFVVRQGTPGLRVGPEALTMGLRASIQNSLSFDGVAVGPDQVLGELGKGMEVAEDALTIGRLCIGAACLGTMKRCAQLMGRYGDRRMVASGRLGENPAAISVMSDLTALISTIEALKDQIAERLDDGQFVPAEAPMAVKILVTDSLNWAAGQLMQLLGGRGYMENNIAPQILRDARALSVGEGPNEPLTVQIGRAARHTENIRTYLDASGDSSDIANTIATISTEVAERCKQTPTFGGSITSVQLWTDWLIGQVALDGLLLSATRESHRRNPAKTSKRALLWAELRFARTLQRARKGQPEEKLLAAYGEIASQVDHYIGSIGDIEQSLPGEEDQLDPFLWKTEGVAPKATRYDLPGQSPSLRENITNLSAETAKPTTTTVSVEEESLASKRERLAKLLKSRIEPTNSENS
jgi:alkylation response protein AidB-like acyl-CoA dehydrogenase